MNIIEQHLRGIHNCLKNLNLCTKLKYVCNYKNNTNIFKFFLLLEKCHQLVYL